MVVAYSSGWPPATVGTAMMKTLVLLTPVAISVGVLSAQQSDTTRNPLGNSPAAVAAGQRLYNRTCQGCHGSAGQGDRGPALNTGTFAHGREDGEIFHTIREGVAGSQMPPSRDLSDEQIWQLVSYIRSLAAMGRSLSADAAATSSGNRAAGEALFFGSAGCGTCHQVNGRGSVVGPDLSTAGRQSRAALRAKILDPNTRVAAARGGRGGFGGQTIVVKTRDDREIRGVRRNEDTFSVQLVDASGQLHLFDKLTLAESRVENTSFMPADYATRLTSRELDDVVA